ncbi:tRNA-dihydrouridine synthase 4 [Ceratobasidium sp. AG-Ba]|nr:tRNA-dihydrouridine synthase 4 [Ceratobasidium sp. AG-Ba]
MRSSTHIAWIVGSTLATAAPFDLSSDYHRYAPRAEVISWKPCENTNRTILCGRFEVPLDYHNPAAGKASLAVARYPATKQPKKGTLFLNPGGPGASGVDLVISEKSEQISNATGGYYDLVSWDPRGVGLTHPRSGCFNTSIEEQAFWERTIPYNGLEARGDFTDQADLDAFFDQVPKVDELMVKLGRKCLQYSPDTFQYVGTTATVRDMVALHDHLEGPDKPINYWGISYGSAIGIYFVNMFPGRVGRVVLDGVVDPVYWANVPAHQFWAVSIQSADRGFLGFVKACAAAGPNGCALASENSTAESIASGLWAMINSAYQFAKEMGGKTWYSSARMRKHLLGCMYSPTDWPMFAETFAGISKYLADPSDASAKRIKRSLDLEIPPPRPFFRSNLLTSRQISSNGTRPLRDYAFHAITCGDAVDAGNVTTRMVFEELVRAAREVSPMFGPIWGDAGLYCHRWPVRAVERYTGPWNKTLSNPILVIGNEADPITPFASAKKVADALGDSAVLVEQDDYGHTSLAMHSTCTLSILERYFIDNTLPSADMFCATNQTLFAGSGVTNDTIGSSNSSGSGNNSTSGSSSTSSGGLRFEGIPLKKLLVAVVTFGCAFVLPLV